MAMIISTTKNLPKSKSPKHQIEGQYIAKIIHLIKKNRKNSEIYIAFRKIAIWSDYQKIFFVSTKTGNWVKCV